MELRRRVQAMRKDAKLMPKDKVVLLISSSDEKFLKKFAKQIEEGTNTKIKISEGQREKILEREFFLKLEK